jgi:alpha-ketoglutarate-dependent taurine dioxygenase
MLEIRQMGPQIGVEITGIDVKAMEEATWSRIYHAWLDHNVKVVRDQELTIPDFIAYSERFGPVTPHPSKSTRHPDHPKITMLGINKFDADGKLREEIYRRGAEGWHTDGAYNQAPFKATQLYALAVPSRGGNTLFANAYAAYDALPQRLKERSMGWSARSPIAGGAAGPGCSIPKTRIGNRCSIRSSALTPRRAASRFTSIPARSATWSASLMRKATR